MDTVRTTAAHNEQKRRSYCLHGVNSPRTIGDLLAFSARELLLYKNFGQKSLTELEIVLEKLGLKVYSDEEHARRQKARMAENIYGRRPILRDLFQQELESDALVELSQKNF
jgi:DNA-directed RNA polymerase alpha subunit